MTTVYKINSPWGTGDQVRRSVDGGAASCAGPMTGPQPGFILRTLSGQEAGHGSPDWHWARRWSWSRKGPGLRARDHLPPILPSSVLSSKLCPAPGRVATETLWDKQSPQGARVCHPHPDSRSKWVLLPAEARAFGGGMTWGSSEPRLRWIPLGPAASAWSSPVSGEMAMGQGWEPMPPKSRTLTCAQNLMRTTFAHVFSIS